MSEQAPDIEPGAGEISGRATRARLDLVSVNRDGDRLLLRDIRGAEYTLPISPELRAALAPPRGDTARTRQENPMDSALRPRDIQNRIRAGESPEAVAEAAGASVDKIMPYVAPVLAEREHVAARSLKSNVRRSGGASPLGRTLGDSVEAQLRAENTDPGAVEWDAWRREDGRWTITALYEVGPRSGLAEFTYDMPGNYVVLDNDDAHWLTGDHNGLLPSATDELHDARQRRLSAISGEDLPLGDDAIELVREDAVVDPVAEPITDPVAEPAAALEPEVAKPAPEAEALVAPGQDQPELDFGSADEAADAPEGAVDPDDETAPARRPVQKKKGRASVPSWDEIMFGGDS